MSILMTYAARLSAVLPTRLDMQKSYFYFNKYCRPLVLYRLVVGYWFVRLSSSSSISFGVPSVVQMPAQQTKSIIKDKME